MSKIARLLKWLFIVTFLTIFTQVGGVIYLICQPFNSKIKQKVTQKYRALAMCWGLFIGLFMISSFAVTPLVASYFGRVPLPIFLDAEHPVRPANVLTCFLNRHYVKPELLALIQDVAKDMNKGQSETIEILYLDANFPFIDGFPLLPHKSHNDGEKLDIAFLFKDKTTGARVNQPMSFSGYGACITPQKGETNMPDKCAKKGYWQYSLIKKVTSQSKIQHYEFDKKANVILLKRLAKDRRIGKIFIEPHLKERLGLSGYKKIRFHGCAAVRHDDHIHIQL